MSEIKRCNYIGNIMSRCRGLSTLYGEVPQSAQYTTVHLESSTYLVSCVQKCPN